MDVFSILRSAEGILRFLSASMWGDGTEAVFRWIDLFRTFRFEDRALEGCGVLEETSPTATRNGDAGHAGDGAA